MPNPPDLLLSIISHISIHTNDCPRAKTFYDAVLATCRLAKKCGMASLRRMAGPFRSSGWGGCNGMSNSGKCFSPNTHGRKQLR